MQPAIFGRRLHGAVLATVSISLRTIVRRARQGRLEVEDILAAGKQRLPGLREALEKLSDELAWSKTARKVDGFHVIPFRSWARVAVEYAEHGNEGLARLAAVRSNLPFVLGMLEEIKGVEAVRCLIVGFSRFLAAPEADLVSTFQIVRTINLLVSLKGAPALADADAGLLRNFLHAALGLAKGTDRKAWVLCALRGVGDATSLELLKAQAELPDPYDGLLAQVARSVHARTGLSAD